MNDPIWRSSQAVHGLDRRTDQAAPVVVGLVETAAGGVQVALRGRPRPGPEEPAMNGRSSHTPVYGRKDLAELVAKHDREYPDHGADCLCENGLITTLRIYFAPAVPIQNTVAPYVPPDSRPAPTRSKVDPRKPWLKRRPGETKPQYGDRISHSCYNCGTFIVDRQALNLHEDGCSGQSKRTAAADPEPE